jgi:hypothetical protein
MSAQPKEEWSLNVGPTDKSTDLFGIARAFAAAQTEMHNPGFDATNPHFRNKFASLAAVRNAVVPILAKHGICVSQDLASVEGGVSCVTILTHATGQQMRFGPLVLPVSKNDAQGFGSAATYARRYALMAVACVVGDDDDDASAATGKIAMGQAYSEPHKPQGDVAKGFPEDEARNLAMQMRAIMESDIEERVKAIKVLDYHDLLNHKGAEAYIAASEQMSAKERSAWKAYVKMAKDTEKNDALAAPTGKRW